MEQVIPIVTKSSPDTTAFLDSVRNKMTSSKNIGHIPKERKGHDGYQSLN